MRYRILTIAFTLLVGIFVVYTYAAVQPAPSQLSPPTDGWPSSVASGSSTALIITTLFGFLSLMATSIFQILRDKRQREWDLQDRRMARQESLDKAERDKQELLMNAELQRVATIQAAIELAKSARRDREQLEAAISQNTALTVAAGTEAVSAVSKQGDRLSQLEKHLSASIITPKPKEPPDTRTIDITVEKKDE